MNREMEITAWQRILILLLALTSVVLLVNAMCVDMMYLYAAVGTTVLFLALAPLLIMKTYDWFSPWSAMILGIIYGCTLPSICMSFDMPSNEFVREEILLEESPDFFIWPSALIMMFITCAAVGYFALPKRDKPIQIPREASPNRLLLICAICAVLSSLAFLAYFFFNGGFAGGLSSKRGTIRTLDVGADEGFTQYGWLRHFAKLGNIGLLLLACYWGRYRPPPRSVAAMLQVIVLLALLVVSIAFPFYSSSRASMAWVVLGFLGCTYYMGHKILSARSVVVSIMILILLIFVTVVRNSGSESRDGMFKRIGLLMLNRHGPDIAVTSHIVNNIPQKLDYQYGATIAVWLIAPVPREFMPNKPLIHSGPVIGQRIYQMNVNGVPPGGPADLYWNFHVAGVILGGFLVGALLRLMYQFFRNVKMDPVLLVPIYIFVVFPIGFKVLTHSIGIAFVMPLVDLVTILMVVYVVSVGAPAFVRTGNAETFPAIQHPVSS